MRLTFSGSAVRGRVSPPASKSHTHRAFFLSSLANGKSLITNPLLSADTLSTLNSIRSIGASVWKGCSGIQITGGNLHPPTVEVDTENSGTTMRLLAGISSMFSDRVTITGDDSLKKRPMSELLNALGQMGVECSSDEGYPPVTVKGPNHGGDVSIDGNISSQYISSLMIVAPMLDRDTKITIRGGLVSRPYLDITSHMMSLFGADVNIEDHEIVIRNGGYSPCNYSVPADFSSAAFPLVAGALAGTVSVTGMDLDDPQGDKEIVNILRGAGASISVDKDTVTSERGELRGMDLDIGDNPDLFPILAVLFSTADGTTRLYGAPQLRFKESDRIDTTVRMLRTIGADIEGTDDGCIIHGVRKLKGGEIDNANDHRIMMAAAVASLVSESPITMNNAECCSVSYPMFPDHMRRLGMSVI